MEVEYLEIDDVIQLHDLALEKYGGLQGVDHSKLEAKLHLPMSGWGSFNRYPSLEEKAAVYLFELASGHCFRDGNKRTAYLSTFTFLDLNGYDLIVDDDEVFRFVKMVADNETRPPFSEVVGWTKKHMYKQEK
ncbi:type II toxin-antitoxin system death-on-curing family toxin [Lentibacillus sediminis]|uniref:type II toxin-antitoxin system death-on-curing family toxin n=1 Tax=Lentibacillus sediminis TaxID=1940529 RepID=UPI000C1C64CF|nr:type II toxin-antitoxin system death-on-curing family toxin [Lentibacillus sediminis]